MLFKPTYKLNIIEDKQFLHKMTEIDKLLKNYVKDGYFNGFGNTKLYYEYYLTNNSKGSVVIVHGFTEFTGKYHEMTWYFLNMGYNVFIYDQRGHGLSQRQVRDLQLIHVDRFDEYAEDLNIFIEDIVAPNSENIPMYLFSQSMGGSVSSLYLSKYNHKISKAVLSAPMVRPVAGNMPSPYLKAFLIYDSKINSWKSKFKFLNNYNPHPKFEFSSDLCENRFLYYLNLRNKNPRYQNSPSTNRWLYEALSVKNKILNKKRISHITAKTLIISASQDTVVRNDLQLKLAKLIPHCRFYSMQGAKHSLYTSQAPMLKVYVKKILDFYNN